MTKDPLQVLSLDEEADCIGESDFLLLDFTSAKVWISLFQMIGFLDSSAEANWSSDADQGGKFFYNTFVVCGKTAKEMYALQRLDAQKMARLPTASLPSGHQSGPAGSVRSNDVRNGSPRGPRALQHYLRRRYGAR